MMSHMALSTPYIQLTTVVCLFLAYASTVTSKGHEESLVPRVNGDVPSHRMLPARVKASLASRDVQDLLRHDHELYYLEDSFLTNSPRSAASVRIAAKRPTLILESFEDQLDAVECTAEGARLSFANLEALETVYEHFEYTPEFFLITSHDGCNIEGERGVYLVSTVSINSFLHRMDLAMAPLSWDDACHSVTVNFGISDEGLVFGKSNQLRRRQDEPPTATAAASTVVFSALSSSQPTPTIHQVHKEIDINFQNTQILPPDFPDVNGAELHGPFIPHGISFGCKSCTATGSMDLLQGEFSIAKSNSSAQKIFNREGVVNETEEIIHFFKSGFIEFSLDSFTAHIELDSAVTASQQIQSFTIPFPSIPLTPFTIPGIASVGPIFSPNVVIGTQVAADLNFTYGFDLTIPPSTVTIDVANVTNSSVTGFSGANITALPFQSEFNNIALTLSASFTPELLLGLSVFGGHGTAGAGTFLNLPTVYATLSQVSNVNAQCEPAPAGTPSGTTNATADIFASLTHLTAGTNLSVGLVAEAEVHAGAFKLEDRKPFTAFETGFPLPTACMSFDDQAKTYAPATAVVASATASAGAKALPGGGKGAAVSGRSNPLGSVVGTWGRLETMAGILAIVFACFLGL